MTDLDAAVSSDAANVRKLLKGYDPNADTGYQPDPSFEKADDPWTDELDGYTADDEDERD